MSTPTKVVVSTVAIAAVLSLLVLVNVA
ncbi:uncharacterized protein OE_4369R [Halobacterium salinarum R1]|nr:uncharacterized protein HBSAL_11725 [Halobacterium salinarum]CAP14799.2 uncharacterized protein OE_4369R [Halobacterium salinarum R1]DAC79251.1 TPA_inf: uncharacterized protein VNG_2402H [Halobacterium salinarum NRC-1]